MIASASELGIVASAAMILIREDKIRLIGPLAPKYFVFIGFSRLDLRALQFLRKWFSASFCHSPCQSAPGKSIFEPTFFNSKAR
jgi:hypothetical protein